MARAGMAALCALIAMLVWSSAQALTEQEQAEMDALWTQVVDTSAGAEVGKATITAQDGEMLKGQAACNFSRLLNADEYCDVLAIVFPPQGSGIDSIYYGALEDVGHVNMDDWTDDVNDQIDEIWESYVEGAKAQSERIGYDVVPLKWVLYPTLNKSSKVMTFGILLDFGGEQVINLRTVKFTRTGYVELNVVTDDPMLAEVSRSYEDVSLYASETYAPGLGFRYADFQDGDKIAAIGAVGVLASAVGVKYSKGTFAAIGAAILLFAKKFWFVFLMIPAALWGLVKRVVGGRNARRAKDAARSESDPES